jgi:hypothetical protein
MGEKLFFGRRLGSMEEGLRILPLSFLMSPSERK